MQTRRWYPHPNPASRTVNNNRMHLGVLSTVKLLCWSAINVSRPKWDRHFGEGFGEVWGATKPNVETLGEALSIHHLPEIGVGSIDSICNLKAALCYVEEK